MCNLTTVYFPVELESLSGAGKLLWKKGVGENKRVSRGQTLATVHSPSDDSIPIISPLDGWIRSLLVDPSKPLSKDDVGRPVLTVSEKCLHDVVIAGLCTECGADAPVAAVPTDDNTTDFVKIGFLSGNLPIMVSTDYAKKMTSTKVSDLLSQQRLILVLDLDSTLVHAVCHQPPADMLHSTDIYNFQQAEELPADAKPVIISHRLINLEEDLSVDLHGTKTLVPCHYVDGAEDHPLTRKKIQTLETNILMIATRVYGTSVTHINSLFKLRPGVLKFLREASRNFELYMYTAGTKPHADSALQILDPGGQFFGDRVFARGSVTSVGIKSLSQILPTDHNMMVVVDDTAEAWAPDVGLFTCYPYFWHQDVTCHFVLTQSSSLNISKERAMRFALNQFSPQHIRNLFQMYAKPALTVKAIKAQEIEGDPTARQSPESRPAGDLEAAATAPPLTELSGTPDLIARQEARKQDAEGVWEEFALERALGMKKVENLADRDIQMYSLISIIKTMRYIFYETVEMQRGDYDSEMVVIPSCRDILAEMSQCVLKGCVFLYRGGIAPALFMKSDLYRYAYRFGARVIFHWDNPCPPTHYLIDYPGPKLEFVQGQPDLPVVTFQFIECAATTMQRPNEVEFTREKCEGRRNFFDTCVLEYADDYAADMGAENSKRRRVAGTEEKERLPVIWRDPLWWVKSYAFDISWFKEKICASPAGERKLYTAVFGPVPETFDDEEMLEGELLESLLVDQAEDSATSQSDR